jgi:hypothetical protein
MAITVELEEKKRIFKCKVCDSELPDTEHLESHYEVHQHESKPVPTSDQYFPQPPWSANVDEALTLVVRVLCKTAKIDVKKKKGKTEICW